MIRDSPTIANISKKTMKSPRFVHEIFRNAFPPIIDGLLVNMLPDAEQYNDHEEITVGATTYWEPTIEATVNGETKYLPWGAEEEWVIEWIGFKLVEDVRVRATIVNPTLSNGGSFKSDFQVGDEDEKYVTVSYCSGWAP
jgi:hypothetical protein